MHVENIFFYTFYASVKFCPDNSNDRPFLFSRMALFTADSQDDAKFKLLQKQLQKKLHFYLCKL